MMKTGKKVSRVEGGILLAVYIAYTGWLFVKGGC
jgi:Ca2+/Na+ antiporter